MLIIQYMNLMGEESYECHLSRLSIYVYLKWCGSYYMVQRGGIYDLSKYGTRNYKYLQLI